MTAFGIYVFGSGAPAIGYIMALLTGFIPCYIPTLIIAFFWDPISDRLSRKIVNEPAPEMR